MTANGWSQIAIYASILLALARPLGGYMTAVFDGRIGFLRPVERAFYALCGVDERQEQHWLSYGFGMLFFHAAGFALLIVAIECRCFADDAFCKLQNVLFYRRKPHVSARCNLGSQRCFRFRDSNNRLAFLQICRTDRVTRTQAQRREKRSVDTFDRFSRLCASLAAMGERM